MSDRPIAIELFSGCGGTSTGLLDAGFDVRLGVDFDAPSIVAFRHNHEYRGSKGVVGDVSVLNGNELLEIAGVDRVDLLVGGPPCQPFSVAGKRQGLNDPRGFLVQEFLRLVKESDPRAVLIENVPALATSHDGYVLRTIESTLSELGYTTRSAILNGAHYGVPQNRRRLIIVGIKGVDPFDFPPMPTHGDDTLLTQPIITSRMAIGDLPNVDQPESHDVPNHEPTNHTDQMLKRFATLVPGKREKGSFHDRLHPDRPSYTLRAGSGNFSPLRPVHYEHDRVITVRESARIQGFSDDFIWPDSLSRLQQYRQVGNAVPPPLARAVGEHIAKIVGWNLDPIASAGDVSTRPNGLTMTAAERQARRERFHRGGASYGKVS
ncbi:DNA cytosine methyltransferase [Isoptericola sp. NPDC056573]|uniref:DNA cytosine methyltransferase n=1 Tax=Isoptericola sp. NPDC056573 TaxID=3345868 RepID=UPI00367DA463